MADSMGFETELRLAMPLRTAAALWRTRALSELTLSNARVRRLQSTYWDSPDLRLHALGLSLRVRRGDGAAWKQTLKTTALGIDTRGEYETPLTSATPSLSLARAAGWPGDADADDAERALRPAFRTEIVRTSRDVRFDDGTVAEVAMDRGVIAVAGAHASARRVRVNEIEIELKSGRAARLYELAWALVHELLSTTVAFATKADRGYALLSQAPAIRRARTIVLPAHPAAAQLAAGAFAESVMHVQGNVERSRDPRDPEGVHQMRVGLRRLRVAASLARRAGLPSMSGRLADDVRWLWALLGRRRDIDVLMAQTWPQVERDADPSATGNSALDAAFGAMRRSAQQALARALRSRRFAAMMLAIGWIAALQHEALASAPAGRSARRFARRVLAQHAKRVSANKRVDRLGNDARHRVRIEAKKLRYAAEFAAGLFDSRDTDRYVRRLGKLQSELGALNDLAVMQRSIEAVAAALPAERQSDVVQRAHAYVRRHEPAFLGALARAARKFERTPPFWR